MQPQPAQASGLSAADLTFLAAPTDSESADAPYNPDVFELRRRIEVLTAEVVNLNWRLEQGGRS